MRKITALLAYFIGQFLDRLAYDKKIAHLNTYLAVSSKIAQTLNLREVIEAVLYSSIAAVAAEAASVLLLDAEKKNFRFYGVEGPAKPGLVDVTFPVDQGLAGYVFQTQKSAIFNDVQQDHRFYGKFDSVSGFQTKNLVAIPLVAGDEKIGVLEVLNKAGDEPFYEDDRLLLESIAEEIAFAIRNANVCEEKQTLATEIQRMLEFQTKLIQTSNDGIIANDRLGNIIIFNEGAERVLGYRNDEVIGKIKVTQLYPPGVAQEVRAKIDGPEYGGPGRLIHYETMGLSKTGEQIPVELSASLIYGNNQEVTAVGFFRDLRERQQLQEKLLQSERLAALGQMAAHISHEVKNPLVVIGGMARQVLKASARELAQERRKTPDHRRGNSPFGGIFGRGGQLRQVIGAPEMSHRSQLPDPGNVPQIGSQSPGKPHKVSGESGPRPASGPIRPAPFAPGAVEYRQEWHRGHAGRGYLDLYQRTGARPGAGADQR